MGKDTNSDEDLAICNKALADHRIALLIALRRMSESVGKITSTLSKTKDEMLSIDRDRSHPYWVLATTCIEDMEETMRAIEKSLEIVAEKENGPS